MKKFSFLITILLLCAVSLFAQAPEKFSYQAVVRNASNALVTNAQVGVRVSILQGSASGNAVYVETHTATTNANGLLSVEIGGGTVQQGTFADIDWANGPYFLKTETDPNGGSSYTVTSTQQLLSVPYALYAKEASNGFSGDYNDLTNRPEIQEMPDSVSAFVNDAGYITMADLQTLLDGLNNRIDSLEALVNSLTPVTQDTLAVQPCPGMPIVLDVDGNVYNTVQIGSQCWMKENLRTTKYADGTPIPFFEEDSVWNNFTEPRCYMDNNFSNIPLVERGYLYNYPAALMSCPTGWHLPSDAEWNIMEQTQTTLDVSDTGWRGNHAGRLAGGDQWGSSTVTNAPGNMNYINRNASGFSAVPAGWGGYEPLFNQCYLYNGSMTTFLSSTEGWVRSLESNKAEVNRQFFENTSNFYVFYSVRCVRD